MLRSKESYRDLQSRIGESGNGACSKTGHLSLDLPLAIAMIITMDTKAIGWACAAAFAGTVLLANWLIVHVGLVDVGFGLQAPAGVFAAGLALVLRDVVQLYLGRRAVVMAILVGAVLSLLVSPTFAVASALAFLASELCDMAVYTPLSERTFAGAVLLSNTVGTVVDSAIFLWLAFGSLAFIWGQIVGKMEMTFIALAVIILTRRLLPEPETA